jgi:hypothetical protein
MYDYLLLHILVHFKTVNSAKNWCKEDRAENKITCYSVLWQRIFCYTKNISLKYCKLYTICYTQMYKLCAWYVNTRWNCTICLQQFYMVLPVKQLNINSVKQLFNLYKTMSFRQVQTCCNVFHWVLADILKLYPS